MPYQIPDPEIKITEEGESHAEVPRHFPVTLCTVALVLVVCGGGGGGCSQVVVKNDVSIEQRFLCQVE